VKDHRISKFVNDLFYDVVDTEIVRDQKEELFTHLSERVNDYMAAGLSFDEAFGAAKEGLGDLDELINRFERKKAIVVDDVDDDVGIKINIRFSRLMMKLVPLAPFIYLIMGLTQNSWMPEWWTWGWWSWAWVIIPIVAILSSGIKANAITAISPFIYILLGVFMGWWLWGWLVIPISAILFSTGSSSKKKKKKKKSQVNKMGNTIEIEKDGKKVIIDKTTGNIRIENHN